MEIREDIKKEDWSEFVKEHPNGNIFQTPEMFEVYKVTKHYEPLFLAIVQEENILAIMLAVIQKEYSGVLGRFTSRSIIVGGPLIKNNDSEVLSFILNEYLAKIKNKVIFSQFRNLFSWGDLRSMFVDKGIEYDPHLDILIDIKPDEEQLWTRINSKARNKIRKAKKSDLIFKVIDPDEQSLNQAYKILMGVYKNAKVPLVDKSMFDNAFLFLSKKNMIKLFCAIKDDKIIGVRVGLLYKGIIYDWYAGSLYEYYKYNPNDFLPFNILVWGHKNSYKIFDFGGAGKPGIPYGVRDHKMKFGGELVEYGRFEIIHNHLLMLLAKGGLKLYKFFN